MNYREIYKMTIRFSDGVMDPSRHPYLVVLDHNNAIEDKLLLLKGKTYKPDKHTFLQETGRSSFEIKLDRDTIFNFDELYECDLNSATKIFSVIDQEDLIDLGLGVYLANQDNLIKGTSLNIYTRHEDDLQNRLREHQAI